MTIKTVAINTALAGLLFLGMVVNHAGFAMGGYTPDQVLSGTVQSIDYLHHTITVNGETYAVSSRAKFTGIGGFSVLHVGMPVQCMLSSSPTVGPDSGSSSSMTAPIIISVTWIPGSA